jgi:heptosyltransferase-1
MRILLVKTSSLGDVIHNLPVVTDLRAHFPDAAIDWVVEEGFADIAQLHPGVRRVIPVALRRWRKSLLTADTWREMRAFRTTLRAENYDRVIDTQGLLKSALITRMAHGQRCGYTAASAREPLASRFYDATFEVSMNQHAVKRNRRLAALAGSYTESPTPDYGIAASPAPTFRDAEAILLTATSRDEKLWAEDSWIAVGSALHERGLTCLLPAGSATERERATRIAQAIPGAVALPPLSLPELAAQLADARIVIGVDTGLVHLAAALGRPTLAVFCATDPALYGVVASTPVVNLGSRGLPPSVEHVLAAALPLL